MDMNKRGLVVVVIIGVLIILMPFISAFSFSDFWSNFFGKITGNAIVDSSGNEIIEGPKQVATKIWSACSEADSGNYEKFGFLAAQFKMGWASSMFIISDMCLSNEVLQEFYCDGKKPMFVKVKCANGCENNVCISETTLNENNLMQDCISNCDLDQCNLISDENKKKTALEQYSVSCDNSLCNDENCARKLALDSSEEISFGLNSCSGKILASQSLSDPSQCLEFCKQSNDATCCELSYQSFSYVYESCIAKRGFLLSSEPFVLANGTIKESHRAIILDNALTNSNSFPTPFEVKSQCGKSGYITLGKWNVKGEEECSKLCEQTAKTVCCELYNFNLGVYTKENCFAVTSGIEKLSYNTNTKAREFVKK
ncbi:MAG: hypothetical protein Q7S33_04140 [Nanoarchaeota archaeon]|nr:hypothetical protein [Nanoarchaeota archaeon]